MEWSGLNDFRHYRHLYLTRCGIIQVVIITLILLLTNTRKIEIDLVRERHIYQQNK